MRTAASSASTAHSSSVADFEVEDRRARTQANTSISTPLQPPHFGVPMASPQVSETFYLHMAERADRAERTERAELRSAERERDLRAADQKRQETQLMLIGLVIVVVALIFAIKV